MSEQEKAVPEAIDGEKPRSMWRGPVKAALQISLTLVLFWLATRKVDWPKVEVLLQTVSVTFVILAGLALNAGQALSARRQQLMLRTAGISLPYRLSAWLFYRGMFYNLALPGGISGDGYKAYFLNRAVKGRLRRIITSLVLERGSGALSLLILCCALYLIATPTVADPKLAPWFRYAVWLAWAVVVVVPLAAFVPLRAGTFAHRFRGVVPISLGVQFCQLLFALSMTWALGVETGLIAYLLAFAASSLASVIPISLGGIGVREYVMSHAILVISVQPEVGLLIAMGYNSIYLLSAGVAAFFPRPAGEIRPLA